MSLEEYFVSEITGNIFIFLLKFSKYYKDLDLEV